MTLINHQCLNFKRLLFFLPLELINYLIFTPTTWFIRILIYKCTTNSDILQESPSNLPCIFESISVTSLDITSLIWRIFSILLLNSASINVHNSVKSELRITRPLYLDTA